ncbi:tryptophan 7-halogenase [Stieleria sp. JC731]|uniref:NAD(P)/FAD-dependent oxidoreductase n=1 Tax=Pirellulaceae TaxID=2691357 RepID=UPI001E51218B|nr:tryptophan 7-halogenase [Stieleria sp. JC731]MCC9601422.1 tryptophan 7-halogenase [Stieleria sp. JC731]
MKQYDVIVIGSGFSGSILSRILASRGRSVLMLDRGRHPRFAIGESSTPIADLLLRRLGERYDFDDLIALSSYGRWQSRFPTLACGKKRGFSYFDHRPGHRELVECRPGSRSLLVAASPNDEASDTHWYRKDVDAYHFHKAVEAGAHAIELINVDAVLPGVDGSQPRVELCDGTTVEADFIVDASGAGAVTAKSLDCTKLTSQLKTHSCATFAHFKGVAPFTDVFNRSNADSRADAPFDSDDAAQHHLIDGGWVWMLRMNNGVTSVGVTMQFGDSVESELESQRRCYDLLDQRLSDYPSLHRILADASRIEPADDMVCLPRLQRLYDPVISPSCVMTPTTATMIDPLHSTGIAHALAGVDRIADLVIDTGSDRAEAMRSYRDSVLDEAKFIDQIVHMAYQSMPSFKRFTAASMVYFAAAIQCEELIMAGSIPEKLWMAGDSQVQQIVKQCAEVLQSDVSDCEASDQVRELIAPINEVGLMDDQLSNRYAYTATKTA